MANTFRRLLIEIGKMLPFICSFILLVSYFECLFALITLDYVHYGDIVVLNKPVSYTIAKVFEYDWVFVFVTTVISYAIETCYWNKLAILYLVLHLVFKSTIQEYTLDEANIFILSTTNVLISGFFVYKGIKILTK